MRRSVRTWRRLWRSPDRRGAVRTAARRWLARTGWLVCLACLLAGCSFCGKLTPVSKDVLKCRQCAQQGLSAIDRGDDARGEALLAQAIQACPVDTEARRAYAEALWRRGAVNESIAQLAEAIRHAPDDPEIRIRMAEMQLAAGQNGKAYQAAQEAIKSDVNQAKAWSTRARALRNAGEVRRALSDCHRALALEPDNQELLLETAEIYRELNQPQRALAQLQTLLETYPLGEEPRQPLHLAGLAYAALERHDEAANCLLAASQRGAPSPDILWHLAQAQLNSGQPARAETTTRSALAVAPDHAGCRGLLDHLVAATPRVPNTQR